MYYEDKWGDFVRTPEVVRGTNYFINEVRTDRIVRAVTRNRKDPYYLGPSSTGFRQ